MLVADTGLHQVLKIGNGKAVPVAGTGQPGFSGDGGPAVQAQLAFPWDVAMGPSGVSQGSCWERVLLRVLLCRLFVHSGQTTSPKASSSSFGETCHQIQRLG